MGASDAGRIERVVLCGAGAVGAAFAERLHDHDPALLAVVASGERRARLAAQGVTVNGRRLALRVVGPGEAGPPADLVLVAVKQHHLAEAVEELRGHVGAGTVILSLLNGISSEGILEAAFGPGKVLPAFVIGNDVQRDAQVVRYTRFGQLVFGARSNDPADPRVARVKALMDAAGIPCRVPADILREQWMKWMLNVGVNQVSAVLRAPFRAFASVPEARDLFRRAAGEVVALAGREGIALAPADVERALEILGTLAPEAKTSMLQDVEAGRKTEVEIFAGEVSRLGRRHGVPTPVNDLLGELIAALEATAAAANAGAGG
jgi:2-dehydropantoate 2-reductase